MESIKAVVEKITKGERNLIIKFREAGEATVVDHGWTKEVRQPKTVGFQFISLDHITKENLEVKAFKKFAVGTEHSVVVYDRIPVGDGTQAVVRTI